MTRSKLSGGVVNTIEEDPTTGAITYLTVACVDGTIRKYVGRITPIGQVLVETATFKDFLVYEYCRVAGDEELVDKHIQICEHMLGRHPDDDPTTVVLNEHLEWVNQQ